MSKLLRFVLSILVLAVIGATAYLAAWDPPAPTARVERVIPNDRIAR